MAGSIGSTIANQAFAREQMNWNSNEAQKQRDYQTSMWNATNEYNSPQQVVQRMRDAGLNPLNGIGDVNQAQAMSGSQANTYARNEMANPLASIDATTSAQIGLANAQAQKAREEAIAVKEKLPYECRNLSMQARQAYYNGNMSKEQAIQVAQLTPLIVEGKRLENQEEQALIEKITKENKWIDAQSQAYIITLVRQGQLQFKDLNNYEWNHVKVGVQQSSMSGASFSANASTPILMFPDGTSVSMPTLDVGSVPKELFDGSVKGLMNPFGIVKGFANEMRGLPDAWNRTFNERGTGNPRYGSR